MTHQKSAPATDHVVDEVAAERRRQIGSEFWDLDHDDRHVEGELARAAAAYALASTGIVRLAYNPELAETVPQDWPWSSLYWKPSDRRRMLIKAAALLVAEVERLDRAAATLTKEEHADG